MPFAEPGTADLWGLQKWTCRLPRRCSADPVGALTFPTPRGPARSSADRRRAARPALLGLPRRLDRGPTSAARFVDISPMLVADDASEDRRAAASEPSSRSNSGRQTSSPTSSQPTARWTLSRAQADAWATARETTRRRLSSRSTSARSRPGLTRSCQRSTACALHSIAVRRRGAAIRREDRGAGHSALACQVCGRWPVARWLVKSVSGRSPPGGRRRARPRARQRHGRLGRRVPRALQDALA